MEYVPGRTLVDYCDHHRLGLRRRLDLFRDVCLAVQQAHQKGIIHRDLKPSNILIMMEDEHPIPKIIDFGIAKAMAPTADDRSMNTQVGAVIGTMDYVSPEQSAGALDVDTRTDIYSLGVVLYQLLIGALPLPLSLLSIADAETMIRNRDAPSLSAQLRNMGDMAVKAAEKRNQSLAALKRRVARDLNWIVSKALDKDRNRRYQSASEFAADIERYLNDEAVLAGPVSLGYQAGKFIKRHKGLVASISAVVVLSVSFAVFTAYQAERIKEEAETATQVSVFMERLFEVSDPSEARGNTITAREILDVGAERIETELADQPVVQARLMQTMGKVYQGIGLPSPAAPLLERAVELWQEAERLVPAAKTMALLADSYFGMGDFDKAEQLLRESIEILESAMGPDHVDLLLPLRTLGSIRQNQPWEEGDDTDPELIYRRAILISENAYGKNHLETAMLYHVLGAWLVNSRLDEAESLLQSALTIRERGDDPQTWRTIAQLGILKTLQGQYEEAEVLLLRALKHGEAIVGPEHHVLSVTLTYLTYLYRETGNAEKGESFALQNFANLERVYEANSLRVRNGLLELGQTYTAMGRYDKAKPVFERAWKITQQESIARRGYTLHYFLPFLVADGQLTRASNIIEDHLESMDEEESALVSDLLLNRARILAAQGQVPAAIESWQRSLTIRKGFGGVQDKGVQKLLLEFSDYLRAQGRVKEADDIVSEIESVLSSATEQ
ncbi:MAG: hypothetical protein DRI24_24325 [Deltaproteobacteria bacterium]|nr:MAG: hypothetical protein DRI24_24325 [Deltaproteobacteria bacterium]